MGEENMKKEMAKLPKLFDGGKKVELYPPTTNHKSYSIDEFAHLAKALQNK